MICQACRAAAASQYIWRAGTATSACDGCARWYREKLAALAARYEARDEACRLRKMRTADTMPAPAPEAT